MFRTKMRLKLLLAVALAFAALAAWVAAPALSLRPYEPGGVDFESSLPDAKRLPRPAVDALADRADDGEKPAHWISPVVDAPDRFDLVGVAHEMRPVEIRVRDDGGQWTNWVEQEEGTPIYVDGANQAQVRAPFEPSGELHFVNVSGTAGGFADRLVNDAREAVNSAFISIASTPVAQAALRLPPAPTLVSREGWGANLPSGGCAPRGPAEYGAVQAAVIHHTVNANDYTPEEAAGIVLGICRFHVNGNGWNDIGYNALVDRYGVLYEGRAGGLGAAVVGAQSQGFNAQTTSIASIGDHTSEGPTAEAVRSIIQFLAWRMAIIRAYPVTATVQLTSAGGSLSKYKAGQVVTLPRVIGHQDLGVTSCPGATLYSQIGTIRAAVQKRIKRYTHKKKRKKKKGRGKKKGAHKKRVSGAVKPPPA